ncbi:hypothetical protein, partial [Ramlibacter sp.]|uniref:hypothetical protein n=1 Tax=Ramlibacter sp. TaxID=1917967 RepID=UPI003D0FECB4
VRRVRRADFFTIENSCRQPFSAGIMHGVSTQDAVQICGATSVDPAFTGHTGSIKARSEGHTWETNAMSSPSVEELTVPIIRP